MKKILSLLAILAVFIFMFLQVITPSVALGLAYGDPGFVGPPTAEQFQAQQGGSNNVPLTSIDAALKGIKNLMSAVVPVLIGLAVIAFLFGVVKYVFSGGQEDKRKEGKTFMVFGIIGIAVMVSVWGLVKFVQTSFSLTANEVSSLPKIPGTP